MDLDRIYGIPVTVSKWLPHGTILPDPNALIPYPDDWITKDLYEKIRWVADQHVMLYLSEDVADMLRFIHPKPATSE